MLVSGLALKPGRCNFGKWSFVLCLFYFISCRQSVSTWIFRLKEDTVLSGNQIHHKVTDAYVALLSRHRKICKCDRICLNHPVRL